MYSFEERSVEKYLVVLLSLCLVILSSCSRPGKILSSKEIVSTVRIENPIFKDNIYISDLLGKLVKPSDIELSRFTAWTPHVSEGVFKVAILQSLSNAGVLLDNSDKARYWLTVTFVKVETDSVSMSLSGYGTAEMIYSLVDSKTDKIILHETIHSEHSTPKTGKLGGQLRLKRASEGAMRKNIETFLLKLELLALNERQLFFYE
ncbi:MAG: hypothetical protein ACI9S8_001479 [Chlamydiales bacterium]|jgi:hypothetical protein